MREKIKSDVENFIEDNPRVVRSWGLRNPDNWEGELTPYQKLNAYLLWNGIQGYIEEVLAAIDLFKPLKPKVWQVHLEKLAEDLHPLLVTDDDIEDLRRHLIRAAKETFEVVEDPT